MWSTLFWLLGRTQFLCPHISRKTTKINQIGLSEENEYMLFNSEGSEWMLLMTLFLLSADPGPTQISLSRHLIFSSQSTEPSLMEDVNVLCITNDLYTIFMTETCQNLPQGFKLIHLFYL